MQTIKHQFSSDSFYIPTWEVQHLFVGTFNPEGGARVPYYYGREKNQFWRLVSEINGVTINPSMDNFFELLRQHKIACVDLIHSVSASEERISAIQGEGYQDTAIINTSAQREYNTDHILSLVTANPGMCVYSTWGKGSKLREWRREVQRLGNVVPLVSPSLAARVPKGAMKFEFMLADWRGKIGLEQQFV